MQKKLETKRRNRVTVILLSLALTGAGCSGKRDSVTVQNEQPAAATPGTPTLSSSVSAGDPKAAAQLVSGFFDITSGWRWTAGKFSVQLKTPAGASERGGNLNFSFTIPEVEIQKLKDLTLSASINGMPLKSATYNKAGGYNFVADVPSSMLPGDTVKVDFALDKTLSTELDKRPLGVIAVSVSIASK